MRNILLVIDNVAASESIVIKALKVAVQCKANLLLCDLVTSRVEEPVTVGHYDDDILVYENEGATVEQLAERLRTLRQTGSEFAPLIDCLAANDFSQHTIKEIVVNHNVWLMILDEEQLIRLKDMEPNQPLHIINNINCPILIMPNDFDAGYFNKISYVTDLRYCDLGVIKFLKVFNAQLFVTHISAPGLPDMDERYAQEILAEEVSTKVNYWKIFLRNIKTGNVKASIHNVIDTVGIRMLSLVNKKHQTFERLFDHFPQNAPIYHNLPTLIFPYLNWFNQASFYA